VEKRTMPTIKQLRKQRHWTQAELALRIDVSPSTVSAWERGRRQPTERQLNALATIFGIDNQAIDLIEQHEPPMSRQEIPAAFTIRIWQEEEAWFALWEAASRTTPGYHERGKTPSRSGTASADSAGGIPHVLTKRATGGRQPGGSPTPAAQPVEPSKQLVYPITADKLVFH
jgi:transcriptional regulator with XRE-family HTH domain